MSSSLSCFLGSDKLCRLSRRSSIKAQTPTRHTVLDVYVVWLLHVCQLSPSYRRPSGLPVNSSAAQHCYHHYRLVPSIRSIDKGHSGLQWPSLLFTPARTLLARISNHWSLTCVYLALVNMAQRLNGFTRHCQVHVPWWGQLREKENHWKGQPQIDLPPSSLQFTRF